MVKSNENLLTPIKDAQGDKVNNPGLEYNYPQSFSFESEVDYEGHVLEEELMVESGAPILGAGNNYHGFPQFRMESRADSQSCAGYRDVSGEFKVDLSMANIFRIEVTGDVEISIDFSGWPVNAYDRTGVADVGLDFAATLLIENPSGHEVMITADHWAPKGEIPDLSSAGFYEIGLAVNWMPGWTTLVRAFPAIKPA